MACMLVRGAVSSPSEDRTYTPHLRIRSRVLLLTMEGIVFASNELKIALAHLFLKYDWELEDPRMPLTITFEGTSMTNPMVKVKFRRRKEEVDLNVKTDVEV